MIDGKWIIDTLNDKIENHRGNVMEMQEPGERYFQSPLTGFVAGDDEIFRIFKEVVGPRHMTPAEIMNWAADKRGVKPPDPGGITVVSYILPLNGKTVEENASSTEWLSPRWAQTRLYGENFNQALAGEMVDEMMSRGILAVAPEQSPMFKRDKIPGTGITSTWSHRHVAYAAGLGTFGIHDFLITEKGAAHRCGSFVVNLKIDPTRGRSRDIHANCLHYQGIPCLQCVARCPVRAIGKDKGHDKEACSDRVREATKICRDRYQLDIYGCGLCSTKVPCQSGIPEKLIKTGVDSRGSN